MATPDMKSPIFFAQHPAPYTDACKMQIIKILCVSNFRPVSTGTLSPNVLMQCGPKVYILHSILNKLPITPFKIYLS